MKKKFDWSRLLAIAGIGLTVLGELVNGMQQKREIRETVDEVLSEREKES